MADDQVTADEVAEAYDATNPRHVQSAKKRAQMQQERAERALVRFMSTIDGRLWMWMRLSDCGVFHSSFDLHGGRMNFNEGKRQIGLQLLGEINRLCPDLYAAMAKENSDG